MKLNPECQLRQIATSNVIFMRGKSTTDMTKIISLNGTSVFLWNSFQGKDFTKEDAAQALADNYDITMETASADAGKWIDDMTSAGLILK